MHTVCCLVRPLSPLLGTKNNAKLNTATSISEFHGENIFSYVAPSPTHTPVRIPIIEIVALMLRYFLFIRNVFLYRFCSLKRESSVLRSVGHFIVCAANFLQVEVSLNIWFRTRHSAAAQFDQFFFIVFMRIVVAVLSSNVVCLFIASIYLLPFLQICIFIGE